MSQGTPKGKGGTVLLSNFTPPGTPNPGAPPPGASPGPPAPPVPDVGGWGTPPAAPPAGPVYGSPPNTPEGYGSPSGMAPPRIAPPAATGGSVPDHVQGQKTKVLGLEQNLGAALGYFFGLPMPLYLWQEPKEHRFVRFHAFQWLFSAILCMINVVVAMIPVIIAHVDSKLTEVAYAAPVLTLPLIPLGICVLIAMFKAFQGKAWKIPVIGGIAEKMAMK
ncbi:MAG: hypothetical protein RMJ98_15300 [Myxococcales bacterium]|nr:hypothetical protein [Myxococcales bacterium]